MQLTTVGNRRAAGVAGCLEPRPFHHHQPDIMELQALNAVHGWLQRASVGNHEPERIEKTGFGCQGYEAPLHLIDIDFRRDNQAIKGGMHRNRFRSHMQQVRLGIIVVKIRGDDLPGVDATGQQTLDAFPKGPGSQPARSGGRAPAKSLLLIKNQKLAIARPALRR